MTHVRALLPDDLPSLRRILDGDPVTHCFVAARLDSVDWQLGRLGSDIWAVERDGMLHSALHVGANVIPIATDEEARDALATRLRATGRRGSSIVGPSHEVLDLWRRIEGSWGRARDMRSSQPLLATSEESSVAPDALVRPVRDDEIDIVLPACVAMFTEEVGVSPVSGGAGPSYRARIAELIRAQHALARIEGRQVVFKAEIGAATAAACQVQGVWVAPERRGEGLSEPGMSAVVRWALSNCAPVVSLYVNDFNEVARRSYAAVGLEEVGEFATVLL